MPPASPWSGRTTLLRVRNPASVEDQAVDRCWWRSRLHLDVGAEPSRRGHAVKGRRDLLVGGHLTDVSVAVRSPCWWPGRSGLALSASARWAGRRNGFIHRSSREAAVLPGPSPRGALCRVRHPGGVGDHRCRGPWAACDLPSSPAGNRAGAAAAPREAAAGLPIRVRRWHGLRRGGVRSHAAVVRWVGWRGGEGQRGRRRRVDRRTIRWRLRRRRRGRATVAGGVAGARVDRAIASAAALMTAPRMQTNSPGCSGRHLARHRPRNTPATITVPRRAQRPAEAAGSALVPACLPGVVRHVDTPTRKGRPRVDLRADIAAMSDSDPRACWPIRRGPCCPTRKGRNLRSSARTSSSPEDVGRFGCESAFMLLAPGFAPTARVCRAKVDPQQATTRGSTFVPRF